MDPDRFDSLTAHGRDLVQQCRDICARSRAQTARALSIRNDMLALRIERIVARLAAGSVFLADPLPDDPIHDPSAHRPAEPARSATALIDHHGRWARHVALDRAISCVMDGDRDGEQKWRQVFTAVLDIQLPLGSAMQSHRSAHGWSGRV